MKLCLDKQCRRLGQHLLIGEFTRNRNRRDGRNDYCRECSVRRNRESRQRKQKRKKARIVVRPPELKAIKLSPEQLVISALQKGARTREEIRIATGLDEDVISDVLASYWDQEALRIVKVGEQREFHLRKTIAA